MGNNLIVWLILGGAVRFYLSTTNYADVIGNRVEVATPLNSYKRVKEGVYLYQNGIDPYKGDMVHETPIILLLLVGILQAIPHLMPLVYIGFDLLTAVLLYKMSEKFVRSKLKQQEQSLEEYAKETEDLQWHESDEKTIAHWVLMAYLFNPMIISNCVGLTSTVFSNLLLSLVLYCFCSGLLLPCLIFLALETMRSFYPLVLIAPILTVYRNDLPKACSIFGLFVGCCICVTYINNMIMQSWSFVNGTLGFIFFYRDLQPNIGLFWYFFTEMFEHFRTMFLVTFQMNATVLYLIPLSVKLRKEPVLLATILLALTTIFRAYPCLGDVGFYLALLPLWRRSWKFMAHNFVVFCFFVISLSMLPALWHLWIYAGSANANFYFGTTLAFSTGQIFLVTDLLFAHIKREFCLRNGQKIYIDGKEAKIVLE